MITNYLKLPTGLILKLLCNNNFKMKYLLIVVTSFFLMPGAFSQTNPIIKIGLVADPQYADKPTAGKRYYKESLTKLAEAIDTFNFHKVDFIQNLGDIIDSDWESYNSILPVYDKLNPGIKNHQLLGNHDFSIDSTHLNDLLEKLSMPHYFYSYSEKGWRFIVLDATDYSYFSNVLHNHDSSQVDFYYNNTKDKSNKQSWNGAIGPEQQNWLKQELESAKLMNQKVILFSHLPIQPEKNAHNLWNDYEIVRILETCRNVVAFINGHNHSGAYTHQNGIHYITLTGMVDTKNNSYGMLEIYRDSLILKGYGNQKTLHLDMK
uniref:metallophosphoesterase n=1 Tax=uncultured Draconibacterium sp. TaxID=1573823 RepID=UPI0032167C7D